MSDAVDARIRQLYRERPQSRLLRGSLAGALLLVAVSWARSGLDPGQILTPRRQENLRRFLGEIVPWPLRGEPFDPSVLFAWVRELLVDGGWLAVEQTLAISILAIVLAQVLGLLLALPAARNLAAARPFFDGPERTPAGVRWAFRSLVAGARALQMIVRGIPEYVWAFLLIGMLGISAWPAVLALALHNAGILGKLDAEVLENLPRSPLAGLRRLGASRLQIAAFAAAPAAVPRILLYFFYRWETCVREATVLGMLGVASLGAAISEARVRDRYDEMVFFVLCGSLLVLIGDLLSAVARRAIRRAS